MTYKKGNGNGNMNRNRNDYLWSIGEEVEQNVAEETKEYYEEKVINEYKESSLQIILP